MFILGTFVGLGFAALNILALVATIRWQLRLGGFWPYSLLLVLFLIPVALCTIVYSSNLSDSALRQTLATDPSHEITSIDQLRPRIIASNNSQIITICGFLGLLSLLLGALTLAKARRLQKAASLPTPPSGGNRA